MKRVLVVAILVLGLGGTASAAAGTLVMAEPTSRVVYKPGPPPRAATWTDPRGFRIQAGRVPDGWLEARAAARTITPGEIALGIGLGMLLVAALGAAGGSLVLFLKPSTMTWSALTRGKRRAILGRL